MPSNIEFKAILRNPSAAHSIAIRLSGAPPQILHQTDVFFSCSDGRLKLRLFGDGAGELILYDRSNSAEPRRSDYSIARTPDAEVLLIILQRTLGYVGTVKKVRALYIVGQTRIHIDQVEGLGNFMEIEVVLRPEQNDEEGRRIAFSLLREFGITDDQLQSHAYIELLGGLQPR
jgi:predicted adenylyl cyclase CyaB